MISSERGARYEPESEPGGRSDAEEQPPTHGTGIIGVNGRPARRSGWPRSTFSPPRLLTFSENVLAKVFSKDAAHLAARRML